jgi:hypothetical protein
MGGLLPTGRSGLSDTFIIKESDNRSRTCNSIDFLGFSKALHYNGGHPSTVETGKTYFSGARENLTLSANNSAQPSGWQRAS